VYFVGLICDIYITLHRVKIVKFVDVHVLSSECSAKSQLKDS